MSDLRQRIEIATSLFHDANEWGNEKFDDNRTILEWVLAADAIQSLATENARLRETVSEALGKIKHNQDVCPCQNIDDIERLLEQALATTTGGE